MLAVVVIGGFCGFLVGLDGPYAWPYSGLYWGLLIAGILEAKLSPEYCLVWPKCSIC